MITEGPSLAPPSDPWTDRAEALWMQVTTASGTVLTLENSSRHTLACHVEDALPAFLTVILIPLTFSITQGILWGFITHAGLYTLAGRWREVGPVMYALAVVSVGLLLLERFA